MSETHYQNELSAFIINESAPERRALIAAHILQCEPCRDQHDSIKLGAALGRTLPRADAPVNTWNVIDAAMSAPRRGSTWLDLRILAPVAALAILVLFASVIYFGWLRERRGDVAVNPTPQIVDPRPQPVAPVPAPTPTSGGPAPVTPVSPSPTVTAPNTINNPSSPVAPTTSPVGPTTVAVAAGSFAVETMSGAPTVGGAAAGDKLGVGQVLVTDAGSRARIEVAAIGQVEVAPNSRVRLVNTSSTEHRLSLERGSLHAKILAPPRLFIVDTPSAVAVDLGCEYTLDVDANGNSKLHVTGGYVSLERDGRESIVPAGAFCLTRKGKGLGTPYFDGATPAFEEALKKFDFENGGAASLAILLKDTGAEDTLTLWHLLPRVNAADREKIFTEMIRFVPLPEGVTREGVMKLDKKMLEAWRLSMEQVWFG